MSDETIYECEDCGHAYTDRYGSLRVVGTMSKWLCYGCQDDRKRDIADRLE